jgi:hypothetical protein
MTFTPQDGFFDPELAPPPDPASEPMMAVPSPPFVPFSPQPTIVVTPPARRSARAMWIGGGVAVAVLAVGVALGVPSPTPRWPNATYTGAPVEASDSSDGVTFVGLDDTIAVIPDSQGKDVTDFIERTPGPATNADDVVAAHNINAGSEAFRFVAVLGTRGESIDDPRARFAVALRDVYELDVKDLSGKVKPITTAQGLAGAIAIDHVKDEYIEGYVTRVVLGRGGNTAVVECTSLVAPCDESALQDLLDTIRIDA